MDKSLENELMLADWYRQSVRFMTPQTLQVNRRSKEAILELDKWDDGGPVTERERDDARECIRIIDDALNGKLPA